MSEKHQCEGRVRYGDWGRSRPCTKTGNYVHEGRYYCKTHHPPSIKERNDAKHDAWRAEWAEEKKTREAAAAKANEQKRRAECFPDLLEALQALRLAREQDKYPSWEKGAPDFNRAEALADAAITKATGVQP